jgi:hypothetical protein
MTSLKCITNENFGDFLTIFFNFLSDLKNSRKIIKLWFLKNFNSKFKPPFEKIPVKTVTYNLELPPIKYMWILKAYKCTFWIFEKEREVEVKKLKTWTLYWPPNHMRQVVFFSKDPTILSCFLCKKACGRHFRWLL